MPSNNNNNIEEENLNELENNTENNEVVEEVSDTNVGEVSSLEKDLADAKDKYIRLYSEFENFRRRTAKEKIETILNASEGLIKDLLPVLDDCERAEKSMESSQDINAVKEGINLIFNKIQKTLAGKGLVAMESKGQTFDADLQECITQFDAGSENKGKVVDEVEKGYYLNDKVIRHAKVVVGS